MRTTIDKEGRVVIPDVLRERFGLTAGAAIEIVEDDGSLRLERVATGPTLVKVGRRLVARPTVPAENRPTLDVGGLVEEERSRRHLLSALRYDIRVETPTEFSRE